MKTYVHIVLCCILMILFIPGSAQDNQLSQFFKVPLLRKPASASLFPGDFHLQPAFHTQWQNIALPFQSSLVSGECELVKDKTERLIVTGGQKLNEKTGRIAFKSLTDYNYTSLSIKINVDLSSGFKGEFEKCRIDVSKVNSRFDSNKYKI